MRVEPFPQAWAASSDGLKILCLLNPCDLSITLTLLTSDFEDYLFLYF